MEAIWCTRSKHWSDLTACRTLLVSSCCRKNVASQQLLHNPATTADLIIRKISVFPHCSSLAACHVLCIRVVFCFTVSCFCFSADLKEFHPRTIKEHKRSSAQMWPTTCCTHFSMVFWLLALWGEHEHLHTLACRSDFQGKWIHKCLSLFHFLFCGLFRWSYPLDGQIFPCCWTHTTARVFKVYTLSIPPNLMDR